MRYKLLLFDLDDTLLDFGANERESLTQLFEHHGFTLTDELSQIYENGRIELNEVLHTRFYETMLRIDQVVDGLAWEATYRELLGSGEQLLMEGALEVCQRLSQTHRLFIITNGITRTQIKRMKQAGLDAFFEHIFDSQSIGAQKPSPSFFDYVKHHVHDFDRREALIIGDSLNTDIKGGLLAGIDTCWVNRNSHLNAADIQSTYTISSLSELYDICFPNHNIN